MRPDIVVEVRGGAVVGVYADLPLSIVLIDWDNLIEPDGEKSFIVTDATGQPLIGVAVPVRPEPHDHMPAETRQVVTFATQTEG